MINTATTRTPQEVEQLLKASWKIGNLQFIGTYDPQPDGKRGFFKNLKTIQGNPLLFPEGILHSIVEQPAFAFIYANEKFIAGKEYKFKAQINRNPQLLSLNPLFVAYKDVIMVDAKSLSTQAIDCKNYVQNIQNQYEVSQGAPKDALLGLITHLASETNKKPETFIFELLQNADDYPDPKNDNKVDVVIKISEDYLILSHNGLPFQETNVYALTNIIKLKAKDRTKTGYKGIGFKSIFKHSNYVLVKSGGFQFRFDEQYYLAKGENTYWQLIPIWTDSKDIDSQISSEFNQNNNVSFYIKPTDGISRLKEYEEIFKRIFVDERVLLFLRSIRSLKFTGLDSQFEKQSSSSDWCLSELEKITISSDFQKRMNEFIKRDNRIPEKYKDIDNTLITFATKIIDGKVVPTDKTRLYAYLPTDLDFGFKFLINGDFIPDLSRDKLFPDLDWNLFLFEEAGYQLLLWLKEIYINKGDLGYLQLIPDIKPLIETELDESKIIFLTKFKQGFLRGLKEVAFIPSFTGDLEILANLIVDKTGFIHLVGVPFFKKVTLFEGDPVIWELDNNKIIKDLIDNYDIGKIFGTGDLISLIKKGCLDEWLTEPSNNLQFFQKIKLPINELKSLKIFLNQDGKLSKAEELYWSVENNLCYIDWLEPQYLMPEIRQALEANEHFKACFKAFDFKKYVQTYIIPEKVKEVINAKLDDRNTSLKFYRFLFKNKIKIDEDLKKDLKWFKGLGKKDIIHTLNAKNIYFSNLKIEEIADKGWLPIGTFEILSDEFIEINDNAEDWKSFWKDKFGIKECDSNSIGAIILNRAPANKAAIVAHIADKNHNLNFYRFLFACIDKIKMSTEDKGFLRTFPIWSYDETIIGSSNGSNIYFSDPTLLDVYERQIVPKSLYNIISDDFCESTTDATLWQAFWKTHFDVKPYVASSFIPDIILDNRVQTDNHQKTDSTHSIKFWSYLFENSKETFDKARLKEFHVLVKHNEGDTARFDKLSHCYLSDEYNDNCIESLVKEFMPTHEVFISPDYGGSECKKWAKFFTTCKIKPDASSLILNDLLPIISGRTSRNDIRLLFKFQEIIEENAQWQTLRNINVLTQTGIYKNIQECFITDYYTGLSVVNDVLPSIYLQHQVSDVYMKHESEREKWLIFWKKFAANVILDDRDKVIEQKLKCLVQLQDTEGYRARHLEHFKDVSELYESVKEAEEADKKIEKLSTKISAWKLTEKGVETGTETVALPTSLFFPSAYNPTFDYEGLGVTDLITIQFVSDSYLAYPNAKEFLKYLGVCESITPNNLKVLTRPNAAHRFWELCLNEWDERKDWVLKYITSTLTCIPCGNTCKIPSHVYSKKIADYVVDKSRLPSVDLRNILIDGKNVEEFLEFKKIPSLPDCLAFLKTQPRREQFDKVIGWLKQYNPNLSELTDNVSIQDFRQTGKWQNADSKWVNVNNLAYFDSHDSEMRRLFNSSLYRIKFPSGTSVQDEKKICTWLAIPMLSESSFNVIPAGKNIDLDFAERLRETTNYCF